MEFAQINGEYEIGALCTFFICGWLYRLTRAKQSRCGKLLSRFISWASALNGVARSSHRLGGVVRNWSRLKFHVRKGGEIWSDTLQSVSRVVLLKLYYDPTISPSSSFSN